MPKLTAFLIALTFSIVFLSILASSATAQSVTFQLYDSNGNQVSQVVFQNVAPGTSSTLTYTMSSKDQATVYPEWNVSNLPDGDTISGYWNGPEVWNVNTGRVWNTWDTVTLEWTLSVPDNGSIASNVIVSVTINGVSPSTTITPSASPTASVTLAPTLSPTNAPVLPSPQATLPNTSTFTVTPTALPTKQPSNQSITPTESAIVIFIAIVAVAVTMLFLAVKYLPRPLVIKTTKLRFISGALILIGILAFSVYEGYFLGVYVIPLIILMLAAVNMLALRRKHLWTMITCEIAVIIELYFVWLVVQNFFFLQQTNNFGTAYGYYVKELTWTVVPFALTVVGMILMALAKKEFKD